MKDLEIKEVTRSEVGQLQKISRETFYETFSAYNTEKDITKYLNENLSLEQLTVELYDTNSRFYFAVFENNIIGYLKINWGESQTELKDSKALEIERIYISKNFHGKNAGQTLFEKAVQIAKQMNADYIWLGVWEKNLRAINFYKKNGFIEFDKHIFMLGNDKQTDIMMKKKI